jgi:hypothetical protein
MDYTIYLIVLEGYNNTIWIFDFKYSKSINGYVFIIGETVVSWKFSKLICIAKTMIELKFIALDKAKEEAKWFKNFF